jgi:hypothetical protein
VEELIPKVTEALDVRLKEIKEQLIQVKEDINSQCSDRSIEFTKSVTLIAEMLKQIAQK